MECSRFKFRVWDKRKKRYDDRYVIGSDGLAYQLVDVGDDWYDLIPKEEVIIEQCTGLKDENDKLIHEGDVVKTAMGEIGVVVFFEAQFAVRFENAFYCSVAEAKEIIGNIHENGKRGGG